MKNNTVFTVFVFVFVFTLSSVVPILFGVYLLQTKDSLQRELAATQAKLATTQGDLNETRVAEAEAFDSQAELTSLLADSMTEFVNCIAFAMHSCHDENGKRYYLGPLPDDK